MQRHYLQGPSNFVADFKYQGIIEDYSGWVGESFPLCSALQRSRGSRMSLSISRAFLAWSGKVVMWMSKE